MLPWLREHGRALALAAGLATVAWLGTASMSTVAPVGAATAPTVAASVREVVTVPLPARSAPEAPAAGRAEASPPPGMTQAQWQALQGELGNSPDGHAELARIADYLAWSDLLRRFRLAATDAAEQHRLAPAVAAGLRERLRQGEVSSAEALQVKAATLEFTMAEPAARAAELRRWIVAETRPAQPDPRQAEFDRRQAQIVAAWSAEPERPRDAAKLDSDLDALRREVFGTPSGADALPR